MFNRSETTLSQSEKDKPSDPKRTLEPKVPSSVSAPSHPKLSLGQRLFEMATFDLSEFSFRRKEKLDSERNPQDSETSILENPINVSAFAATKDLFKLIYREHPKLLFKKAFLCTTELLGMSLPYFLIPALANIDFILQRKLSPPGSEGTLKALEHFLAESSNESPWRGHWLRTLLSRF